MGIVGHCAVFSSREVSRYDERGVAWYWNEFTMNEHTGTHFDAPVHWISGRDHSNDATATIPPEHLIAPAVVVDLCVQAAADPDLVVQPARLEEWEAVYGRIPAGA